MLWARLRAFLRHRLHRSHVERSTDQEIQSYLDMDIEEKVRSGLSPDEARRATLVEFGGIDQVKEEIRDARAGAWVDACVHDTRAAFRTVCRTPAFSCSIVASLALGLGAVIAAIGFLNGMLFRSPSGFASPDSLVRLSIDLQGGTTADEARRLTQGIEGLSGVAAEAGAYVAIGVDDAQSVRASLVSDNFFDVLGVGVLPGRSFRADDDPHVAVIGHQLWTQAFAQAPDVIGRTIRVADVVVEIVGVAPNGFTGLGGGLPGPGLGGSGPTIWLPLRLANRVASAGLGNHVYIGRLDPGADVSAARAQLAVVAKQFAQDRGLADTPRVEIRPLTGIDPIRAVGIIFLVLSIPVAVLAIASVNAAGLLLARASLRGHEIAIRLALGARRGRLVRQLLIESLLLSCAATTLSLPFAHWGLAEATAFFGIPFSIDARLIGIAVLTAAATAVSFGLAPALTVSALRPMRALAGRGNVTPGQVRTRKGLVVAQVALSIGVMAVGTQLVAAFSGVNATRAVDPNHVLMASLDLRQVNIPDDDVRRFYEELVERASKLPDVDAAGAGGLTAFWRFNASGDTSTVVWTADDAPDKGRWYPGGTVVGDLFQVAGARVWQGRTFTRDDHLAMRPQVAVVNRVFAETLFNGAALGQSVRLAPSRQDYLIAVDVTIVGVIEPTWTDDNGATPTRAAIYFPAPLTPDPSLTLYVRTRQPEAVAGQLRHVVRDIDSRVPFLDVATLAERSARAYPESWMAQAAGVLGVLALLLAAFGLAALVSYLVTLRSREIAVRMAIGARPGDVLRMVVMQAMRMAAAGGAIGIPGALIIGQFVRAEFHQALGVDLVLLTTMLMLLVGVAFAASAFPALRASRISPLALLKEQ